MPQSGRNEYHSIQRRAQILEKRKSGNSIKDIAFCMDMTIDAVKGVIKRSKYQKDLQNNPRPGRPPALSDRDKIHIKILIERNAFISYQDIIDTAGLTCHRSTIRRWLLNEGIQHRLALRRPFLSASNAAIRKDFTERYKDKDIWFWYSWWFSDEVSIDRTDGDYTKWSFYRTVSLTLFL
jgi:transposase